MFMSMLYCSQMMSNNVPMSPEVSRDAFGSGGATGRRNGEVEAPIRYDEDVALRTVLNKYSGKIDDQTWGQEMFTEETGAIPRVLRKMSADPTAKIEEFFGVDGILGSTYPYNTFKVGTKVQGWRLPNSKGL